MKSLAIALAGVLVAAFVWPPIAIVLAVTAVCVITGIAIDYLIAG